MSSAPHPSVLTSVCADYFASFGLDRRLSGQCLEASATAGAGAVQPTEVRAVPTVFCDVVRRSLSFKSRVVQIFDEMRLIRSSTTFLFFHVRHTLSTL